MSDDLVSDDLVRRLECYADLNDAVYHPWVYREASDRIEKLEAALREIAFGYVDWKAPDISLEVAMDIARKALDGKDD